MPLRTYQGTGEIQIDGRTLAEANSVRFSVRGNNNNVTTMKRGLAGRSRGAVTSELSVENAVPLAGLEDEFVEKCVNNADVRVTVLVAGRRYQFEGWIESVDAESSVNSPSSVSFSVTAGPPIIL